MKQTFLVGALVAGLAGYGLSWMQEQGSIAETLAPGNEVEMYSLSGCGHCIRMKEKLDHRGIPYREILVNQQPEIMNEIGPQLEAAGMGRSGSVPFFRVNGNWLYKNISLRAIEKELKFR